MLEIANGVGEAHAEREMAAGVLIEQCIVEQDAGLVDRGVERHERTFAEIGAALVHGDELGQQRFVFLRAPFGGLALAEANPEPVNELALIAQRLA